MASDDVGEGIADEDEINRAFSEPGCGEGIVGGEGNDFLGAVLTEGQRGK